MPPEGPQLHPGTRAPRHPTRKARRLEQAVYGAVSDSQRMESGLGFSSEFQDVLT